MLFGTRMLLYHAPNELVEVHYIYISVVIHTCR